MPDFIDDINLENTFISMMSNIKRNIEESDIEACHNFGKPDVRSKHKKTVVRFANRKSCNKILENQRKLAKLNNEKHNFREGTKTFICESLTPMNEFIAFNCRKLKRKELIRSRYSRNGNINIRMADKS